MAILYKFRTKNFTLLYSDEEETVFDLSWDDTGEARAKLDSGEWQMFTAKVAITFRGSEVTSSYLGGCIYPDPKQFRDHIGSQGRYGSYFRDMVRECIANARMLFTDMPVLRPPAEFQEWVDWQKSAPASVTAASLNIIAENPIAGWDSVEGGARSAEEWSAEQRRREDLAP